MKEPEEHYRRLERMYVRARSQQFIPSTVEIAEGKAIVRMPILQSYFHALDALHGAFYFKVMDDAAFFAVSSLVQDVAVLTTAFNIHFTRPVTGSSIAATAIVVSETQRLFIADAVVVDEHGREVGRGTGTFMRSKIPLTPDIGYA
jgi:uncharacterized protein (TIGR00369 family)